MKLEILLRTQIELEDFEPDLFEPKQIEQVMAKLSEFISIPIEVGPLEEPAEDAEPEMEIITWSPICRGCGCTNDNACLGGCSWAEKDLCSTCVESG